jgi:hypothetical protein
MSEFKKGDKVVRTEAGSFLTEADYEVLETAEDQRGQALVLKNLKNGNVVYNVPAAGVKTKAAK